MTFQLDLRFFHFFLLLLRSHAGSLAQRCHQTKEPGPEYSEREREIHGGRGRERQRTPGTTPAAVCVDIQGWLIYGPGRVCPCSGSSTEQDKRSFWQCRLLPLCLSLHSIIVQSMIVHLQPDYLPGSPNSDRVLNEVGKHEVISLSLVVITSGNRAVSLQKFSISKTS